MACKFVLLAAFVATARAGLAPVAAPVVAAAAPVAYAAPVAKVVDEYDPAPQYTYAYDVQDALTGDSKNQFETRNGDVVQGRYSLIEADGSRRIVDYTADPINGFNAVVQREPLVVKAAVVAPVAKVAAPVIAAPVAARLAAPVVAAPVAKVAAPVAPVARLAAAPVVAAPFARVAAPVAAPVFARFAAPVAYSAPVVAGPAKFVAPAPALAAYSAPFVAKYF